MQDRYESEIPRDHGERGAGPPPAGRSRRLPLLAVTLLFCTITLGLSAGWHLAPHSRAGPPAIETVTSADFDKAVTTLSPRALQQDKADARECRMPMGFITAATPGNPAGGTVRFRTSRYESPPFVITDKPQRIAIPNPMPEGGIGPFSVEGNAKGLVVALTPPANMEPVNGTATTQVIFPVSPPCKP